MLTAHRTEMQEARAGVTARSRAAAFVAAIELPFDLDSLLVAVAEAVVQHAEAAHDTSGSFSRKAGGEVSAATAPVDR